MAVLRTGHEVLFHYRTLALAGDDLAARIITGIQMIGIRPDYIREVTSGGRRELLTSYIAVPDWEFYRQLLGQMLGIGWHGWCSEAFSEAFSKASPDTIQPHDFGPDAALTQWWFNVPDDAL